MNKITQALATGVAAAMLLLLTSGLSQAQSPDYCYNHPGDSSHYCFCYHHPNQCNGAYRSKYPDWNRPPDWRSHPDYYRHSHPDWYGSHDHPHWNSRADRNDFLASADF